MQSKKISEAWAKDFRKQMVRDKKKIIDFHIASGSQNIPNIEIPNLSHIKKNIKKEGATLTREMKERFLMIDFFPENKERFLR